MNIAFIGIVFTFLSLTCFAEDTPGPERKKSPDEWIEDSIRKSTNHFVCAGIGYRAPHVDDATFYFFDGDTRQIIATCGYWIAFNSKNKDEYNAHCPPPAWRAERCSEKYREWKRSIK